VGDHDTVYWVNHVLGILCKPCDRFTPLPELASQQALKLRPTSQKYWKICKRQCSAIAHRGQVLVFTKTWVDMTLGGVHSWINGICRRLRRILTILNPIFWGD
jgi:hypothetical protein